MRKRGLFLVLLMSMLSSTVVTAAPDAASSDFFDSSSDFDLSSEEYDVSSDIASEEAEDGADDFDWSDTEAAVSDQEVLQALLEQESSTGRSSTKDAVCSFNEEDRLYHYAFPNQGWFESNVPNGAVTKDAVRLHFDRNSIWVTIKKDDEEYDPGDRYYFSEPGSYECSMMLFPMSEESENISMQYYHFSFRILKNGTSRQGFLTAPDGYTIEKIDCNGQSVRVTNPVCMYLEQDGKYEIRFTAEGFPDYRLSFRKDTMAPILNFSQSIKTKAVSLPFSFHEAETDSEVTLYRNGTEVVLSGDNIAQGGWYQLRVSDPAGNSRTYEFYVNQEASLLDEPLVILLGLAVLFGGILLLGGGWSFHRLFHREE